MPNMNATRFFIEDASKHDGEVVTIKGWVYNKRSSGKIKFVILRDGTGMMQGVLFKGECSEQAFEEFERLTQESSVEVTGKLRKEPRSVGGYELGVQSIKVVQVAEPYPISPKEHGVEFLMENRHLWVRSSRQWAALRVRSEIMRAINEFFDSRGYIRFDAPILTPSACEGTSTLFSLLTLMKKPISRSRGSSTVKWERWLLARSTSLVRRFVRKSQRHASISPNSGWLNPKLLTSISMAS